MSRENAYLALKMRKTSKKVPKYCEVEKKRNRSFFAISSKVIVVWLRYLQGRCTRIISFFPQNFTVEISTLVEISGENPQMEFPKSGQNRHVTSKNPFFPRDREIWTQFPGFGRKLYKHNFSRLQNTKIGQIGRNIEKSKKSFSRFLAKIRQSGF